MDTVSMWSQARGRKGKGKWTIVIPDIVYVVCGMWHVCTVIMDRTQDPMIKAAVSPAQPRVEIGGAGS